MPPDPGGQNPGNGTPAITTPVPRPVRSPLIVGQMSVCLHSGLHALPQPVGPTMILELNALGRHRCHRPFVHKRVPEWHTPSLPMALESVSTLHASVAPSCAHSQPVAGLAQR